MGGGGGAVVGAAVVGVVGARKDMCVSCAVHHMICCWSILLTEMSGALSS